MGPPFGSPPGQVSRESQSYQAVSQKPGLSGQLPGNAKPRPERPQGAPPGQLTGPQPQSGPATWSNKQSPTGPGTQVPGLSATPPAQRAQQPRQNPAGPAGYQFQSPQQGWVRPSRSSDQDGRGGPVSAI